MPFDDTMFLKMSVDIMSFFDPDQLRKVTPDIEHNEYTKGQPVLFKGQITDGFYIIKKGKATVFSKAKGGEETIAELAAGDFFGEMSVLDDIASTASVRAAEDGTEILTIPSESFEKLLQMQPLLKKGLLDKIAERQKKKA
ncbi:MAG: cyclic nucleotide-binding domain-containing protein [Elusimicrobiota bacterium]